MASNPFFVMPGNDYSQGLAGLGQTVNQLGERKRQRDVEAKAQERFESLQAEITAAYQAGDADELAEISIRAPEFRQVINKLSGTVTAASLKRQTDFEIDVLSDPDNADEKFRRHIKFLDDNNRDSTQTRQSYADYLKPEEGAKQRELDAMRIHLATNNGEAYKAWQEIQDSQGGGGGKISPASPKDFTVESMAEYESSGNIADLKRYRPQIRKIAGIDHQVNQQTGMWEPLVDMRGSGISEQVKALAKLEAEKQSKLDFAKAQSKFQDSESNLLTTIESGKASDVILQDTAAQIKTLASGWSTEWGAALSKLPGAQSRQLKGLLNTIRANSAFTTLTDLKKAGGTLGAISEAELVLLEAKLGALDQAGTREELFRVIDQILEANTQSIIRTEGAYNMDKKKYGSSFEEAAAPGLSDEDLLTF